MHNINSHNVTNLGWICNHLPDQFSKANIIDKINNLLPTSLQDKYQINVKTVPYFLCKITHTRAFVIEMDNTECALHSTTFFENLTAEKGIVLVPYNSDLDRNNKIKNFFYKQNEMLATYTTLVVHNLFGIDQKNLRA